MTTSSLPLHCSICPKKPDFSDVSHLLTHVASKGHLSHYYKIKVRSSNDPTSRQLIDMYDQWYSDWNVEGLMMERLNLKDRKRSKNQGLSVSLRLPKKPLPRKEQQVDPLLTGTLFGAQSVGRRPVHFLPELEPGIHVSTLGSPMELERKVHKPRLHLWSTIDPGCNHAIPLEISSSIPSSPPPRLGQFPRAAPLAQMFRRTEFEVEIDDDEEEIYSEATKLKGVLWPGMNIFDAATPDMKRRRNQKKEISVVARLERNSFGVEASEMIFTPKGSLWKQRPISGHVDFDSSPYKFSRSSPPPPKRRNATRAPLTVRDSNKLMLGSHRTSTSRRAQRADHVRHAERMLEAETELELELEVEPAKKKKKRDFAVLDERNIEPVVDTTDMKMLTSEFQYGQLAAYEPPQRALRSLDGPLAALYQPAFSNNYFPEAFDGFQQSLYGMPYYAYYAHAAYDIPGVFTYSPQLPRPQDLEKVNIPDDKTLSDTTHVASAAASDN